MTPERWTVRGRPRHAALLKELGLPLE